MRLSIRETESKTEKKKKEDNNKTSCANGYREMLAKKWMAENVTNS
jgi:predicted RNA-binding protein with RPS1 domain